MNHITNYDMALRPSGMNPCTTGYVLSKARPMETTLRSEPWFSNMTTRLSCRDVTMRILNMASAQLQQAPS
jgi:hypothetical protein